MAQLEENYSLLQSKENSYKKLSSKNYIISSVSDHFLYSTWLVYIIPPVFKTQIFLGQEVKKKKKKSKKKSS